MVIRRLLFIVGLFSPFLSLIALAPKSVDGQTAPPPDERVAKYSKFDDQWQTFQKLGFTIRPEIAAEVIDKFRKESLIEERPFAILYMELGRPIQREPWTELTDRVWDFDTESIEDNGDYVEIMKNLGRITRGELKFESLKDFVDVENKKAWVSFILHGKSYK